jgi:hypothetical protein
MRLARGKGTDGRGRICRVPFGPISRVGSKNACGVARVVFQEPSEPCTTLKATWTLCVLTDHRKEGGVAKMELAKNNVLESKGLGVILSTSETRPTLENQHPTLEPGPVTQPLAVGDVTGYGATPRTEAPQALTWRGEPRRPRASPLLLARGTDAHRPTPRRGLHQERWRIQAALAEMAHEGLTGAVVLRDPLGHAPTEGGGARIREGWHRRGGPPARVGAGMARWGSAVPAWFLALLPVLRPSLGTVSLSPYAMSSAPAQDPRGRPWPPS